MEKNRQKELINWLKQQSIVSRYWLNLSKLLGILNGLLITFQAWLLAYVLHCVIIKNIPCRILILSFISLSVIFIFRFWIVWLYERVGFHAGQNVRYVVRHQILDFLQQFGPVLIQKKSIGDWTIFILEQIDSIHDYYSHYLPQLTLTLCIPLIITIAIFPINWAAALIQLCTAPLILLFIVVISARATDISKRNFQALSRLSGYFFDRLRGIDILRIFNCGEKEIKNINQVSQNLRQCTMEILYLIFLSSGVLEFFTSLSIALVSVYFGFSYLGELNFGHYGTPITLLTGFLTLVLTPEFFRPLRDLGAFYHAKAQAISAADNLKNLLEETLSVYSNCNNMKLNIGELITLEAKNLHILSVEGKILAGPLNFKLLSGQRIALVGFSGSGKSSLINVLMGFLFYTGSLQINGIELRNLNLNEWRKILSWVGQNPQLLTATLRDNILLGRSDINDAKLYSVLKQTRVNEFLNLLPKGLDTIIGDQNTGLSVGQVQRIAIARALISPCKLLLLDEPTANLDMYNEQHIMNVLNKTSLFQSTLIVTHQLDNITEWDSIWVMRDGCIIEQGDYSTLYSQKGVFFTLFTRYKQGKI